MDLRLRETTASDLDFVLGLEADPEAAPYILPWSRGRHEQALADPDEAHLVVLDGEQRVGYVLLAGLASEHYGVELRRIVTEAKGHGLGRRAARLAAEHAFGLGAQRVWLDHKLGNERARRAYEAAGFVHEGILRQALRGERGYESVAVMSLLAEERSAPVARPAAGRDATRMQVERWIALYERAWRSPGTAMLAELFTPGASYRMSPYDEPVVGLEAIGSLWEREREGPQESFTLETTVVAAEGDTGVVRAAVEYGESGNEFRDLWIVRLAPDGRCRDFEEWAFSPGGAV